MYKFNEFSIEEKFYMAAWQGLSMNGSSYIPRLLEYFSTAKNAWEASDDDVVLSGVLGSDMMKKLLAERRKCRDTPHELHDECHRKGISLAALGEKAYPRLLGNIYNPPQILFYRGHLQGDARRISIVGSRKVTPYGKSVAELLGKDLSEAGIHVVSGGAAGVDSGAHRGALKVGITEVVLGCGVDVSYPSENRHLFAEIAETGALISEFAPEVRPRSMFFPMRNRIISGMSRGTVVVEAAERSGSLITAEYAINENRDVFAVPGSVFSENSRGCNRLIQQGAKLITGATDIIAEYPDWQQVKQTDTETRKDNIMEQSARQIMNLLTPDVPLTIDEIIYRLQGPIQVDRLSCLLLRMEIKGLVRKCSGGYIAVP